LRSPTVVLSAVMFVMLGQLFFPGKHETIFPIFTLCQDSNSDQALLHKLASAWDPWH